MKIEYFCLVNFKFVWKLIYVCVHYFECSMIIIEYLGYICINWFFHIIKYQNVIIAYIHSIGHFFAIDVPVFCLVSYLSLIQLSTKVKTLLLHYIFLQFILVKLQVPVGMIRVQEAGLLPGLRLLVLFPFFKEKKK